MLFTTCQSSLETAQGWNWIRGSTDEKRRLLAQEKDFRRTEVRWEGGVVSGLLVLKNRSYHLLSILSIDNSVC